MHLFGVLHIVESELLQFSISGSNFYIGYFIYRYVWIHRLLLRCSWTPWTVYICHSSVRELKIIYVNLFVDAGSCLVRGFGSLGCRLSAAFRRKLDTCTLSLVCHVARNPPSRSFRDACYHLRRIASFHGYAINTCSHSGVQFDNSLRHIRLSRVLDAVHVREPLASYIFVYQ